jgi:hypothetical protein
MEATTDQATPISMAQHTYWNLGGHHSGVFRLCHTEAYGCTLGMLHLCHAHQHGAAHLLEPGGAPLRGVSFVSH